VGLVVVGKRVVEDIDAVGQAGKIANFKDLKIWQRGMALTKTIYEITSSFSSGELYGMVSQMRRSAVSIPSNIAEGFVRQHSKEYRQFLYVSLSSLAELETQIIISEQLGYIDNERSREVQAEIETIGKMTRNLIKRLQLSKG
jgi:four helix bundle protein